MKRKEKRFIRNNPHRPVQNLQQTLNYYHDVLGFSDEWTWQNKDGNITDGGIRRDDLRLIFGEDPEIVAVINGYEKSRLPLLWFVDNIDEIYKEFLERKVEITDSLKEHPYGLREFAIIDINGYYIRVAEPANEEETMRM